MDHILAFEAARAALQREGVEEATGQFSLELVDDVTRWVVAVAIESAAKTKIADAEIAAAATVGDLVDLACGMRDSTE
ncbi:MAG: hypothetical protein Q3979_06865 [Actinomycetaceae bacterium]|nr:hypothetical protein [Actinomycetaceae bacterium]